MRIPMNLKKKEFRLTDNSSFICGLLSINYAASISLFFFFDAISFRFFELFFNSNKFYARQLCLIFVSETFGDDCCECIRLQRLI